MDQAADGPARGVPHAPVAPSGRRVLYSGVSFDGRQDADLMLMGLRGQNKRVLLPGEGSNFINDMGGLQTVGASPW